MDFLLYVFSFPFSFFFIILSYWKEDRTLNILGSFCLLIMAGLLITGVQMTSYVPTLQVTTSNVTGNYTTITYSAKTYNDGVYPEPIGIALFMTLMTAIQYLYFSTIYAVKKEEDQLHGL